jgi:hypothetical protein
VKVGDRVRYVGPNFPNQGREGVVLDTRPNAVRVRYSDKPQHSLGLWFHDSKFEVIMPKLDTARPLYLANRYGGELREVPFITMTSEGHILVGRCEEGCSAWSIYDANGNWVRSEGGGSQTKLVNKPARRVTYQRITGVGSVGVTVYESLETLKANWKDEYVGAVKVTAEDGKVVSVELVR